MTSEGGAPVPAGAEVLDSDGERMGTVVAAAARYIVVERGLFFPTDIYVPRSAIVEIGESGVSLNVTKAHALAQGWEVNPAEATPEAGDTQS